MTTLAVPRWSLLGTAGLALLVTSAVSWALSLCGGRNLVALEGDRFVAAYTTMWQVQAGIAAVALPVLLFVIELSKDERQAATRTHEVLIRETCIFPIIVFALAGTVRLGIDITWFPYPAVFVADLILVLGGTIVGAAAAYLVALNLLFSPSRMKARAMALAREKMTASLDESIEVRLANNRLSETLARLKVGFWFLSLDRDATRQYAVLHAPVSGTIADIHLGRLEAFIDGLPWRTRPAAADVAEADVPTERPLGLREPDERVWVLKRYGETFGDRNRGLLRLDRSAFEDLDVSSLERHLRDVFRIRRSTDA
jgi:hypothetical protein